MTLITETALHDKITELRRQRSLHLMDESDYTQKIIDLIKEYGTQERIHYERSGMAFVHATVIELTDDKKLLDKLDKIVQEKLSELKQPREGE